MKEENPLLFLSAYLACIDAAFTEACKHRIWRVLVATRESTERGKERRNLLTKKFSKKKCFPSGSFWLNPPLPRDAEGNWYGNGGGDAPQGRAIELDVDPL